MKTNNAFSNHAGSLTTAWATKLLPLLLLLLLLALPATVRAQFNYDNNFNGTATITGYTGPGGDVTIPDTIDGLRVTEIGHSAFWGCPLTTVVVGASVTDNPDGGGGVGSWLAGQGERPIALLPVVLQLHQSHQLQH